ncbi:MAG TPA: CRISPR-associated endoribonuclease Cas6 [Cyclobacteriaceae bacterium]
MRIRITFKVKNKGAVVPFHHQYLLSQTIKGILLNGNSKEFADYNFYNFSGLKGQTRISKNGLHYQSNKVTLVLSTPNQEFVDYFLNELFIYPSIQIGNLNITPESVEEEYLEDFNNGSKYICISPLIILKPNFQDDSGKRFVEPQSDEFSDYIFQSTIHRMGQFGIDVTKIKDYQKFQVVPDNQYIKRLRNSNKKFARIYPVYENDIKFEVRGYTFPFILYAPMEMQDFVFTCGLGNFCHKGFGMLDIANRNPISRAVPYDFRSLVSA